MKKTVLIVAIAAMAVGAASAQPFVGRGYGYAGQLPQAVAAPAATTVTGTLGLVDGRIAIKDGDKTYIAMSINRLVGFVDGLKEGATVKAEGLSHEIPGVKDTWGLIVDKLTIGDRVIDLDSAAYGRGAFGMRGGMAAGGAYGMRGGMGMRGGYSAQPWGQPGYGYGMTGRAPNGWNR